MLELLSGVPEVTTRKMMGEYLLYAPSPMLVVDVEDPDAVTKMVEAMLAELPEPRRRRR